MTKIRRALVVLACAAAVAALLWALGHLQHSSECRLWRAATNFGHVPLFGLIALALLGFSLSAFGERWGRGRHLFLALAGSVVVAGASEVLQVYTARTVEAQDYLRNLAGGGSALALWASLDRRLRNGKPWARPLFRRSVAALGPRRRSDRFHPGDETGRVASPDVAPAAGAGPVRFRLGASVHLDRVRAGSIWCRRRQAGPRSRDARWLA